MGKPAKKAASKTAAKKKPARAAIAKFGPDARLGKRTEFRIYPSIGVARVGDSVDGFVVGPEAPGIAPKGPYRGETDHGIKPQAARFRIYKVQIDDDENETVTEEVTSSANVKIEWTVRLANRKAAGSQIFNNSDGGTLSRSSNPKPRNAGLDRGKLVISASGQVTGNEKRTLAGEIEFARPNANGPKVTDIVLARLETDEAGRLLVIGGPGTSGSPANSSIPSFSDNNGWYDSVSDGPVEATLSISGKPFDVVPAWAIVTVPRFAPEVYGIVTWYDCAVNMARTGADGTFNPPRTTSFTQDIYPILERADRLSAVHAGTHSESERALSDATAIARYAEKPARARILAKLTQPGTQAAAGQETTTTMPLLFSGANPDPGGPVWTFLALTKYQMTHVQNWVLGNFDSDWPGAKPAPPEFADIPIAKQAWALTEAALTACVGGSFFPGIEGTYDIARIATYRPEEHLRQEFRVDPAHPAGFLSEKMALPWQADFADCSDYWWPSQRPVNVTADGAQVAWDRGVSAINSQTGHLNMVRNWNKLGFVTRDAAGKFIETERTLPEPLTS